MTLQKTHSATIPHLNFNSKVDIIVPFHGQYEKVTRLIESILRFTYSNIYNLCLVDDASPNSSFIENLSKTKMIAPLKLQCVRCKEQRGFGGALEVGFNKTNNPWIVFLHSDCLVEDVNWLKSLGEASLKLKAQGVRMVSARTNNAMSGDPGQEGEKGKVVSDIILEEGHLSMYAFMVHRELFSRVGGFIKSYPYGYYEDEEFAYRLRQHGFKQGIAGASWIHHEGEATIRSLWRKDPGLMDKMLANKERCIEDMRLATKKSDPPT